MRFTKWAFLIASLLVSFALAQRASEKTAAVSGMLPTAAPVVQSVQQPVTQKDWPVYGGDNEGTHYSSLDQINSGNVGQLEVAWTFESGDTFMTSENECNPLMID